MSYVYIMDFKGFSAMHELKCLRVTHSPKVCFRSPKWKIFTVINYCWHTKRLCGSVIFKHFIRQCHSYMMTRLRSNHSRPGNCISYFLSPQSFLTGFTAIWYRSKYWVVGLQCVPCVQVVFTSTCVCITVCECILARGTVCAYICAFVDRLVCLGKRSDVCSVHLWGGGAAEDAEICPARGDPLVCWMEVRNATIDKHAASYETTAVQLKSTLCVLAIQHKREVNPRY